jgi:hypothetical protein
MSASKQKSKPGMARNTFVEFHVVPNGKRGMWNEPTLSRVVRLQSGARLLILPDVKPWRTTAESNRLSRSGDRIAEPRTLRTLNIQSAVGHRIWDSPHIIGACVKPKHSSCSSLWLSR